jgi:hypothetical protein
MKARIATMINTTKDIADAYPKFATPFPKELLKI